MFKADPIPRLQLRKTAEVVASQIRNAIVRGDLGAENTLPPEAQLIADFQVSRPTIREAIRILESENLIRVVRGARGGARISKPTSELVSRTIGLTLQAQRTTLDDVYQARLAIEPMAARLAAEQRPRKAAAALQAHVLLEQAALTNRPLIAKLVAEFHRLLVEQSGNRTLALVSASVQEVAEKHLALAQRPQRESEEAEALRAKRTRYGVRAHEKLAELIETADGIAVQRYWEDHMKKAADFWLRGFGAQGLDVLE